MDRGNQQYLLQRFTRMCAERERREENSILNNEGTGRLLLPGDCILTREHSCLLQQHRYTNTASQVQVSGVLLQH